MEVVCGGRVGSAARGHACPLRASILAAGWADWLGQQGNRVPARECPSVVSETQNQRPTLQAQWPPGALRKGG